MQDVYGPPEVLRIEEVSPPTAGPGEVAVRVRAASVNARDWHLMRGEPKVARLMDRKTFGRKGPNERIRGTDFAGVVEVVGAGVTGFAVGDEVMGECDGAFAEYVACPANQLAAKPAGLAFEQAAAIPLAANTALMCLREAGLGSGQRLLINGASGGVGTFAVQLGKVMDAHVTAVCSTRNVRLVRSVGNRSLRELGRVVTPKGTVVLSGGGVSGEGRIVGPMALFIRGALASSFVKHRILAVEAEPSAENLRELAELVDSGAVTVTVERTYPFDLAADAIRHLETEHARAKVAITLS